MAYIKVVERGCPEKYKDTTAYEDLGNYCLDLTKSTHIGVVNLQSAETASTEMAAVAQTFKKEFGKRISHIILSFKKDEVHSASTAAEIAALCSRYYAPRYQVLWAVHTDPQIHIHIIVNRVSFIDGRKYPDRYEDRSNFWKYVHRILASYGIQLWK